MQRKSANSNEFRKLRKMLHIFKLKEFVIFYTSQLFLTAIFAAALYPIQPLLNEIRHATLDFV
jgi:hypothetical protein